MRAVVRAVVAGAAKAAVGSATTTAEAAATAGAAAETADSEAPEWKAEEARGVAIPVPAVAETDSPRADR